MAWLEEEGCSKPMLGVWHVPIIIRPWISLVLLIPLLPLPFYFHQVTFVIVQDCFLTSLKAKRHDYFTFSHAFLLHWWSICGYTKQRAHNNLPENSLYYIYMTCHFVTYYAVILLHIWFCLSLLFTLFLFVCVYCSIV